MISIERHVGLFAVSIYLIGINLVTLAVYAWDKWTAKRGSWRVPEATLHGFGAAGGTLGALLGQQLFRHKTRKLKFQLVFWLTVVLQGGLLVLWLVYW